MPNLHNVRTTRHKDTINEHITSLKLGVQIVTDATSQEVYESGRYRTLFSFELRTATCYRSSPVLLRDFIVRSSFPHAWSG